MVGVYRVLGESGATDAVKTQESLLIEQILEPSAEDGEQPLSVFPQLAHCDWHDVEIDMKAFTAGEVEFHVGPEHLVKELPPTPNLLKSVFHSGNRIEPHIYIDEDARDHHGILLVDWPKLAHQRRIEGKVTVLDAGYVVEVILV